MSRKRILWVVPVAFIAIGYLSSWISVPNCERKTAGIMIRALGPEKRFFVRSEQTDESRQAMWKSMGAVTAFYDSAKYDPATDRPLHMPRADLGKASPVLPFLTCIDYFWIRAPQVGSGGTLWYFCLFGLTVELGHTVLRAS